MRDFLPRFIKIKNEIPNNQFHPIRPNVHVLLLCSVVLFSIFVDGVKVNHDLGPLGLKLPAKTSEIQYTSFKCRKTVKKTHQGLVIVSLNVPTVNSDNAH